MGKILWIHRAKSDPGDGAFEKSLRDNGFEVTRSVFTDGLAWEPLLVDAFALLVDLDKEQWGKIVSAVRSGSKAWLPLIGVGTKKDSWLFDAGADDFIDRSDDPKATSLRLRFRYRQAEERRVAQLRSQEQASSMAKTETAVKQREEFLSVCAHDLRSPLGLIQTGLSMVLNSPPNLSTMQTELVTRARRQAGQAIKLVNDLLDVMALEQGLKPQYQLLGLDRVLKEFHNDYRMQADEKKIGFHYQNAVPDWKILGDADRIRQLLQNLITNALKFTDSGKNVYLSVAAFQGRRRSDPPYPMVILSLKDEGKGIPPGEIQKVFDRFQQLKDNARTEGRGLGLTVAKQISNLHDGNVWVESAEGKGSTFFVLFAHVLSQPAPGVTGTVANRVLIAEPSLARRDLFFSQLGKWGYETVYARDGVETVTLSHYLRPSIVILTPGLQKLKEGDVANILKEDPTTEKIKVIFAAEPERLSENKTEVALFDETLPLPFTERGLKSALLSLSDKPDLKAA